MRELGLSPITPDEKHLSIILASREVVNDFIRETNNYFSRPDIQEILTQISFVLLNDNDNTLKDLNNLPEVNRMRNKSFVDDPIQHQLIRDSTQRLAQGIHHLVTSIGAYELNQHGHREFPYFFGFLTPGNDMLLDKLPNFN